MKKPIHFAAIAFLSATAILFSCRRDLLEFDKFSSHIEVEPNYVIPLIKANITLGEILKANDSIEHYAEADGDELIRLAFRFDSLKTLTAKDYMTDLPIIDTTIRSTTLGLVPKNGSFEDQFVESVMFKDLLTDYFLQSVKTSYENYNGSSLPAASQAYDRSKNAKTFSVPFTNIRSAQFAEGNITAEITNNYNVPVSFDLVLTQSKNGTWTDIGRYKYTSVVAKDGGTASQSIPAAGITLENVQSGGFGYYFENFRISNIAGGTVDMYKALNIRFILSKCKLSRGEIKLSPNQQYFGQDSTTFFDVTVVKEKRVYEMLVKEAQLSYSANSSFDRDIRITMTTLDATKNNIPLKDEFTAIRNKTTDREANLKGYLIDFTADPVTPYNKIKVGLQYHLNEFRPNEFIKFDSANRVDLTFTNAKRMEFEWIKGNMELDTIDIDEGQVNFNLSELLANYFSGQVKFADPSISVYVDNGCGIDGMAALSMKAQSKNGSERSLFKSGNTQKIDILAPAFTEYLSSKTTTLSFDKNNSNIVDLLSVIPDKLIYSGTVYTNDSNRNNVDKITNHLHWDSKTNIGADLIIPLHMSIRDLTIRKHFATSFRDQLLGGDIKVDQMEELSLYFNVKNQFPLDIKMVYTLWDTIPENDIILDTLYVSVLRAQAPDAVGKVGRNLVNIYSDSVIIKGALLDNFLDANMVRADVVLNTAQNGKEAKFYTHYNLQLGIMAGFKGKFIKE